MKVYKLWSYSNKNYTYIINYYLNKETAKKAMEYYFGSRCAADPDYGIKEIDVVEDDDAPESA